MAQECRGRVHEGIGDSDGIQADPHAAPKNLPVAVHISPFAPAHFND